MTTPLLARRVPEGFGRHAGLYEARTLTEPGPLLLVGAQCYVVVYLLLAFGTFPRIAPMGYVALAAAGLGLLLLAPRATLRRIPVVMISLPVLAWAVMSLTWTLDRSIGQGLVLQFVPPTAVLLLLVGLLDIDRVVRAVLVTSYVIIVVTAASLLLWPSTTARHYDPTGETPDLPGWHGTFDHKNIMAPALIFALVTIGLFEPRRIVKVPAAVVIGVLLVGSQSATGMSGAIVAFAGWLWVRRFQRQEGRFSGAFVVLSAILLVLAVVITVFSLPLLTELYGKDLTFTGRTQIWSAAWWGAQERPWQGFGYGGVWYKPTEYPTFDLNQRIGFPAFHAHNGPLDLLLNLGIVGLGLFVMLLVSTMAAGWRLLRKHSNVGGWLLVLCVALLFMAIGESLFNRAWTTLLLALRVAALRIEIADRGSSIPSRLGLAAASPLSPRHPSLTGRRR
jgi:O-antigen ligase